MAWLLSETLACRVSMWGMGRHVPLLVVGRVASSAEDGASYFDCHRCRQRDTNQLVR